MSIPEREYWQLLMKKSVTHTSQFLLTLEARMGFKIKTIQTDNGREFTNYGMKDRLCLFDKV